jgi:hypothetical protein
VWKNGTPINPLKLESPPAEPVKPENVAIIDSLVPTRQAQLNAFLAATPAQ